MADSRPPRSASTRAKPTGRARERLQSPQSPSNDRGVAHYGWLGQFPQMREWLSGEREVKLLEAFSFAIINRKFESTVGISRDDFADGKLGLFKPMIAEMGHTTRQHPDTIIFPLLEAAGFTSPCYDAQYFFDAEHPVDRLTYHQITAEIAARGPPASHVHPATIHRWAQRHRASATTRDLLR
ncbi:hypothetical protein EB844_16285 [Paracoccus pantotrophus]|nr:hypothetical protein EB844_16285 [Paracoccus pantotrophus]